MGWHVVPIPFFEWGRLHQPEQRDAYVNQRLSKHPTNPKCDTDKHLVGRCCAKKALSLAQSDPESDSTWALEGSLASWVW